MFKILDRDFKKKEYGEEPYLDNWPMLYILENRKEIYIGISNHVKMRMGQHHASPEKNIFKTVHFIYSSKFNRSVIEDYESKLIQYITADQVFQVTNKNAGMAARQYYEKKAYDQDFEELWKRLYNKNLVRHSLLQIENTDLFKYSPYKELNDSQLNTVSQIFSDLKDGTKDRVVVKGMPGSGKTIVAVFLFKYLKDSEEFCNKKIGLVIPQTSLRKTIQTIFRSIKGLKPNQVLSPSDVVKEKYDILLVDEAHRLHQYKNISYRGPFKENCKKLGMSTDADELDWVIKQSDCTILFYDEMQVIGPSGINADRLDQKWKGPLKRKLAYYELETQMRVKGGKDYIDYVRSLLDGSCIEKKKIDNYEFKLYYHFNSFRKDMYQKEKEAQYTRMVAGFAWEWKSKNDSHLYDITIENINCKWNHCTAGWIHTDKAIHEIGCIHSIQGYDLNYAFVIIGKDIGYDADKKKIIVRQDYYFDKNGKNTASYEELLAYIKNVYYVLMTRGIKGTYLYVCDDALREYLGKYMDVVEE